MTVLTDVTKEIRAAEAPVSSAMQEKLTSRIDSAVQALAPINEQEWWQSLQTAIAVHQLATSDYQESEDEMRAAHAELKSHSLAQLIRFVVCLLCWFTCIAGEFAITYSTLPFLLDIPEDSFLGVAISAVVVAMLTVVEWGIARVLEEPWSRASDAAHAMSGVLRAAISSIMVVFVVVLLAGNVYTVQLLSPAREEAMKLRENLTNQNTAPPAPVDQPTIDRAITAISVAVVIDGSILFLALLADLRSLDRRMRARLQLWRLSRRLPELRNAMLQAQAAEAVQQRQWDERVSRIAALQAEFRDRCMCELQAAMERKPPAMPELTTEQRVDLILARGRRRPLEEAA
jgi:hypothetical protein